MGQNTPIATCVGGHSAIGYVRPRSFGTSEGSPALPATTVPHRSLTSFVGRRRELDAARACLQHAHLVSLIGPGGVGKTRLAEELAARSARAFRDSVRWIDLAAVRDPDTVPSAAAAALGVTDQSNRPVLDKLADHTRSRHMLIVVDNCEHLLPAVITLVTTLLDAAPEIRIVTTSREPLGIAGEQTYVLPPLGTPPAGTGCRAVDIAPFEAVTLLVERARNTVSGFELTDANADAVAQLCRSLDGIPLAVELAATRLRSLSPSQLVERIDRRFALLTGGNRSALPRQQTLRALIDWSHDLCSDDERLLWARLSVFPGSFDLEAAEAVCGFGALPEDEIVDLLDRLVAKSLVGTDRATEDLRYLQLMTVREYGAELAESIGETAELFRRHRDHYAARAARSAQDWCGSTQREILTRLRIDHPNHIAALDWSLREESSSPTTAEFAVALRYHWIAGGNLADGRSRIERILHSATDPVRERGDALWVAAWIALIQGDHDAAEQHLIECHSLAATLADDRLRAHADHWAALHALFRGRTADAIAGYESAIGVHRAHGDTAAVLTASFQLAMAQIYDGRADDALTTCNAVLDLSGRYGENWNRAYSLWVSSLVHLHQGASGAAVDAARDALRIQRSYKDKICTALSIEVLAWTCAGSGDPRRSAQLFGAADAVWTRLGTDIAAFGPHVTDDSRAARRRAVDALGEAAFGKLAAEQAGTTIDEAVAFALGESTTAETTGPKTVSPLTKRELEIAMLIAEGRSNRAVAEHLVISSRTVDGHVERILAKLGFASRTQIAAWVAARTT